MRKLLCKAIFKIIGWRVIGPLKYPKKCIVVVAPHTSNWDFIIGSLYRFIIGVKLNYLIKSELFVPVLGYLFKLNGGIPVYRKSRHNKVEQFVEMFNVNTDLKLVITPEGTRSKVERWKKGFYYIAIKANLPIVLCALDFGKKEVGIINSFTPSGNIEKDLKFIQDQFYKIEAKIPENYNKNIK